MKGPPVTWGLDMSTSPSKTAAVAIEWASGEGRVIKVRHPLAARDIPTLMAEHQSCSWAVDVPFGWPDQFVALMQSRHECPLTPESVPAEADWETWRTKWVAQRSTDEFLTNHRRIRTRPLPASFQLLGATAAMWALIEGRLAHLGVPVDRAGISGNICETYPRAALAAWGSTNKGKADWNELQQRFPFIAIEPDLKPKLTSDDVCDAVVCALVARARLRHMTLLPDQNRAGSARREGWIHVSLHDPSRLIDTLDGHPRADSQPSS